jgi:hypothetical protein
VAKAKAKRRDNVKLSATESLRWRHAEIVGGLLTTYAQLAIFTVSWWRWTCGLAIAIELERRGPIL